MSPSASPERKRMKNELNAIPAPSVNELTFPPTSVTSPLASVSNFTVPLSSDSPSSESEMSDGFDDTCVSKGTLIWRVAENFGPLFGDLESHYSPDSIMIHGVLWKILLKRTRSCIGFYIEPCVTDNISDGWSCYVECEMKMKREGDGEDFLGLIKHNFTLAIDNRYCGFPMVLTCNEGFLVGGPVIFEVEITAERPLDILSTTPPNPQLINMYFHDVDFVSELKLKHVLKNAELLRITRCQEWSFDDREVNESDGINNMKLSCTVASGNTLHIFEDSMGSETPLSQTYFRHCVGSEDDNLKIKGFCKNYNGATYYSAYTECGKWFIALHTSVLGDSDKMTLINVEEERVVKLSSARNRIVALTSRGKIFAVRVSIYELTAETASTVNITLEVGREKKIFSKIACSLRYLFALTTDGYGFNDTNAILVENQAANFVPMKKLAVGPEYVITLDRDGKGYFWSYNEPYESKDKDNFGKPTELIEGFSKKFIRIAACPHSHLFAAMTENSEIYVWSGVDLSKNCYVRSSYKSFYEIYAFMNPYSMTYKAVNLSKLLLRKHLWQYFDNAEFSDLILVVEKREIFIHTIILKMRLNHFHLIFKDNDVSKNEDNTIVEIKNGIYKTYRTFLKYLYAKNIKFGNKEHAFEVLKLADKFGQKDLKEICQNYLKGNIDVECAAEYYLKALNTSNKVLKNYCFDVISEDFDAFVRTDGFQSLNWLTGKKIFSELLSTGVVSWSRRSFNKEI